MHIQDVKNKLKSIAFSPAAAPVAIVVIGILLHASFSVAAGGSQVVLGGSVERSQVPQSAFMGEAVAVNPIGDDLGDIGSEAGPVGVFDLPTDSVAAEGIFGPLPVTAAKPAVAAPIIVSAANHCGLTSYLPTGFMYPAPGPIGDLHGHLDPLTGKPISVDIPNKLGTTVVASGEGTVIRAEYGWDGGYGNVVEIDHGNGLKTLYGHLNDILVAVGDHKVKGDPVGFMGTTGHSTGPHVHFEVRCNYD